MPQDLLLELFLATYWWFMCYMFVIVKQQCFAPVDVMRILLLDLGVTRWKCTSTWRRYVLYYFLTFLEHFLDCKSMVFKWKGFCSAKACKNASLTGPSSLLLRADVGFQAERSLQMRPLETYAPCPLVLQCDGDQSCEHEVTSNGSQGQRVLNENGFSSAIQTGDCMSRS